jgi:hypothetical protein
MENELMRFGLAIGLCLLAFAACAEDFAAPRAPANVEQFGRHIQRTMTLLATSTPEQRHRVRILFYGQSVTAGPWSHELMEDIKQTWPDADLVIENRAIGGYQAEALIHTAEYDLYPFYPDLVVFHCWGGVAGGQQEEIIKRIRQRTTSEVLLWTTHFRWPPELARDAEPNEAARRLTEEDDARCALLRELAARYGCELAEVREPLRAYLQEHNLFPKDTLQDSVHPNALGNFLIRSLIRPYLRYDPGFAQDEWKDMVRDYAVDAPEFVRRGEGSVRLSFSGNKVEVLAGPGDAGPMGSARVLIDGKAPSEYPELFYHSRPTAGPGVWWPAINRIGFEEHPVPETWTLEITECDLEKKVLRFSLSGSVTGPDGEGSQDERFVSNSGRVVIDKGMWMVLRSLEYRKIPLPEDYVITWETRPLFADTYTARGAFDPGREYATTLAQGLSNGPHTLELIANGDGAVPIESFRVYEPPVK